MRYLLPVILLPVILAFPAWGQQTGFRSQDVGNARLFDYAWSAPDGTHQMRFALNLDDIRQAEAEFQPFDNTAAQTVAFKAVQTEARGLPAKLNLGNASIDVSRNMGGYDVRAKGVDAPGMEKIATDLRTARNQAMDDYVTSKFYSKIDDIHIMPDHKRIAKRYVGAMAPLATALQNSFTARSNDPRDLINYTMHFWQSIPYDELENRYTSNGAGFETPYGILAGNKGDCDSKSVALAATLRAMYPSLRLTMVYVPDHAFVGIGLPQGPHDYALKLGDGVYVLADPTGPSFMNLGQVADHALHALNSGQFSYQEIPF
jgi:hypothetical protein